MSASKTVVISLRLPRTLARQLAKLASLSQRKQADYIRVKLSEIARLESERETTQVVQS